MAVVTAEDNRWHRCDLKTISLLGNVLMRQLAAERGRRGDGDVPRRLPHRGVGVERPDRAATARIVAPPKDNLILPGITYDATLEFAREAGVPLDMRPVPRDEALAADEMWLSSSTKEVLAITTRRRQAVRRRQARARCSALWAAFQARKPHPAREPPPRRD